MRTPELPGPSVHTLRIAVAERTGCLSRRRQLRFTLKRVELRVVDVADEIGCKRLLLIYLRFETKSPRVVHITIR